MLRLLRLRLRLRLRQPLRPRSLLFVPLV